MLAVERPKPAPVKIEIFTNNELAEISSTILSSKRFRKYYPIYLMGITTGARLGEILGLKRCSIGNDYILINNSLQQLSGKGLYDEEPKTEVGKHKITITSKLQNCFNEIFQEQKIIFLDYTAMFLQLFEARQYLPVIFTIYGKLFYKKPG